DSLAWHAGCTRGSGSVSELVMARIDTLPTLPDLGTSDDGLDGWACDTEPGLPPEPPPGRALDVELRLEVPLEELVRRPRLIEPWAGCQEVAPAIAGSDGDPIVVADRGRPLGVVRPGDVVRALMAGEGHQELPAT